MGAAREAVGVNEFDGVFGAGEGVAAVDSLKSLVVGGFEAEFEEDRMNRADRTNRTNRTNRISIRNALKHF